MNTHDIELPPLPYVAFCRVSDIDPHESHHRQLGVSADTRLYTEDQVRTAIEAGRKRSLLWDYCPECGNTEYTSRVGCGNFCTNCGQEWHSDIDYSEAVQKNLSDRNRRGEPVAYIRVIPYDDDGNFQRDIIEADKVGDLSLYADFVTFVPLYTTPQPDDPVVKDSLTTPDGWQLVPIEPTEDMSKAELIDLIEQQQRELEAIGAGGVSGKLIR